MLYSKNQLRVYRPVALPYTSIHFVSRAQVPGCGVRERPARLHGVRPEGAAVSAASFPAPGSSSAAGSSGSRRKAARPAGRLAGNTSAMAAVEQQPLQLSCQSAGITALCTWDKTVS